MATIIGIGIGLCLIVFIIYKILKQEFSQKLKEDIFEYTKKENGWRMEVAQYKLTSIITPDDLFRLNTTIEKLNEKKDSLEVRLQVKAEDNVRLKKELKQARAELKDIQDKISQASTKAKKLIKKQKGKNSPSSDNNSSSQSSDSDSSILTALLVHEMLSSSDSPSPNEPYEGGGGSFSGAGASGSYEDSNSSDSSYSSDSSSSYDSSSSDSGSSDSGSSDSGGGGGD